MARIVSSQDRPAIEQASAEQRRLLPREHGAYAQITFPLLTALALGTSSSAQLLWITAAIALFLAHEPLVVLAGERGRRRHAELGEHAQKLAAVLSVLSVAAGGLGWWNAPRDARLALIVPMTLAGLLVPLIAGHREKTLPGELLASVTLATLLIPVGLAGGVPVRTALIASGVWATIFALGTLTVRAVIASVKKPVLGPWPAYISAACSFAAVVAALFLPRFIHALPELAAIAVLPSALVTFACSLLRVHPRHLREMGWSLVGSNFIALAALIVGLR